MSPTQHPTEQAPNRWDVWTNGSKSHPEFHVVKVKSPCLESCQCCWRAFHSRYQASRSDMWQPKLYLCWNYSSGQKNDDLFCTMGHLKDTNTGLAVFSITLDQKILNKYLKILTLLEYFILLMFLLWVVLPYICYAMTLKLPHNMKRICVGVFLSYNTFCS